jgi:hypothetical protein
MLTFIAHWIGLDNASGPIYAWWSGFFGDITILSVPFVLMRKHNCHEPWCWRIGRFPVEGTPWLKCRRHHPHDNPGSE